MKIVLAFVGRYASKEVSIDNTDFTELIKFYKKQFIKYDVDIKLFTWNTDVEIPNVIEIHKYDEPNIEYIIQNINNFKNKGKDLHINEKRFIYGASFINIYRMFILRKYAMEYIHEHYKDSYVFLLRPDNHLDFGNLKQWIKPNEYVTYLRRAWRTKYYPHVLKHDLYNKPHVPITDLISVGDSKLLYDFYNMDNNNINKLFSVSASAESSIFNRLHDLKIQHRAVDIDCKNNYLISKIHYDDLMNTV
jgi:hypothetical protein